MTPEERITHREQFNTEYDRLHPDATMAQRNEAYHQALVKYGQQRGGKWSDVVADCRGRNSWMITPIRGCHSPPAGLAAVAVAVQPVAFPFRRQGPMPTATRQAIRRAAIIPHMILRPSRMPSTGRRCKGFLTSMVCQRLARRPAARSAKGWRAGGRRQRLPGGPSFPSRRTVSCDLTARECTDRRRRDRGHSQRSATCERQSRRSMPPKDRGAVAVDGDRALGRNRFCSERFFSYSVKVRTFGPFPRK